jgi:hypothetical protein
VGEKSNRAKVRAWAGGYGLNFSAGAGSKRKFFSCYTHQMYGISSEVAVGAWWLRAEVTGSSSILQSLVASRLVGSSVMTCLMGHSPQ